ncbi:MAG TPA: sensor histidine kinase [Sphaerochaeta sp.]|nr:sensor histidine kinase [Sphaerochaeta sp.]
MKQWIPSRYFYKLLISFLLLGVVPLFIVGPITYALTRTILYKRVHATSDALSQAVEHTLAQQFVESLHMVEAIIGDAVFEPLFYDCEKGDLTHFYDSLYLLLAGREVKPVIHIIDKDFTVALNTGPTPKEYYMEQYRTWGVLRRALVAQGEPVIYYHSLPSVDKRFLTLAQAKLNQDGQFEGIVFVDLNEEQIEVLLSLRGGYSQQSIILLDEHFNKALTFQADVDMNSLKQIVAHREHMDSYIRKGSGHPSFIFSLSQNEAFGFTILTYYPLTQVDELLRLVAVIFVILASMMTAMSIILALFVSRNAAKPLSQVVDVLEKVGNGDFSAHTDIERKDEFGTLGQSVNQMVERMKHLIDTNRQKEQSLRTSEIKSLMSQTKPHFIFNCLETIKWYILLGDTKEASETVVELGSLLRSSLDLGEGIITVEEEIEFIGKYISLQKRRMGDRLHARFEVDPDTLAVRIPRLLFQPVVENAIMHGLEKKVGRGELLIRCYKEQGYLHFVVKDDGLGMSELLARNLAKHQQISDVSSGGSGLQNLVRRLHLYYGESAGIQVSSSLGCGTQVSIYISLMVGL